MALGTIKRINATEIDYTDTLPLPFFSVHDCELAHNSLLLKTGMDDRPQTEDQ